MKFPLLTSITILKDLGFDVILFFAGIAGGIAVLPKASQKTRLEKFTTVVSGGFTANYLTPVVAEWLNMSDKTLYGLAFLLGYGGLKFVEVLYAYVASKFPPVKIEDDSASNQI
jgi:hypothetical protein